MRAAIATILVGVTLAGGVSAAGAVGMSPTARAGQMAGFARLPGGGVAVTDSWSQPGYDASNAGYNPTEKAITTTNVDSLTQSWHHGGDGTYSDPVAYSGKVILTTRSGGRCSGIEALSENTGRLAWGHQLKAFQCTDPVIANGSVLMVTNNPWKLYAWKVPNGQPVQTKTLGQTRFSGLTVGQDRPTGPSSGPLAFSFVNGSNGWVKSFSPLAGREVWAYNTRSTLVDTRPVLSGGVVYVVSSSGTVFGIGAVHGHLSWKSSIPVTLPLSDANLAVADGKLFVASGPNVLYAINISTAGAKVPGKIVWKAVNAGYNSDFAVVPQGLHHVAAARTAWTGPFSVRARRRHRQAGVELHDGVRWC